MAESVREQILENIVTTLETIDRESGYFFTVAKANRHVGGVGSVQQSPTLFVNVGAEQVVTKVHDYNTMSMALTVEAWVRSDKSTLARDVERILADIRQVIQVDYTRGGLAIQTDYAGCTEPVITDAEVMWGTIGVQFNVLYRTLRTDPKSF